METLRTPETQRAYDAYKLKQGSPSGCWLCEKKALKTFTYWKISENSFPYDRLASTHHMLVPIRHTTEKELRAEELQELEVIKETVLNNDYEFLLWATLKHQSVPSHHHTHLVVSKYKQHMFESNNPQSP